jgi:hypothetical protein
LNVIVLIVSLSLFAKWYHDTHLVRNSDYRRVAPYSPVLDRFDFAPTAKKINGTLYPSRDGGSIARHQPNAEDDAIW